VVPVNKQLYLTNTIPPPTTVAAFKKVKERARREEKAAESPGASKKNTCGGSTKKAKARDAKNQCKRVIRLRPTPNCWTTNRLQIQYQIRSNYYIHHFEAKIKERKES